MLKEIRVAIMNAIVPIILIAAVRLICMTVRVEEVGETRYSPKLNLKVKGSRNSDPYIRKNFIYAFWHSRIMMSIFNYRYLNIHTLVSTGRVGEILTRALNHFGFQTVRGSPSRGAVNAILQMEDRLKEGMDIAITPDGSRGPKQQAKIGAVYMAAKTRRMICPMAFGSSDKIELDTWDNFVVPKPFSKGVFVWGNPIEVDFEKMADEKEMHEDIIKSMLNDKEEIRDLEDQYLQKKRQELEDELNRVTAIADAYFTESENK